MEVLVDFLLNNYIWLLMASLIIIFALIGYLVDSTTEDKTKAKKKIKPIADISDEKIEIHPSVKAYTNDEFDDPLIK